MDTASVRIPGAATNIRKLRTFLDDVMDAVGETGTPAICLRIRRTRERLKDQWEAEHAGRRGNPYTQEKVAARVGVTLGAYRRFETDREPNLRRLREIASALGLDEDYFLPTADLASATARVAAEADRLQSIGDELERFLTALRGRIEDERLAPPRDEHA